MLNFEDVCGATPLRYTPQNIEAIARESGVGKPTISRWSSRNVVGMDVFADPGLLVTPLLAEVTAIG